MGKHGFRRLLVWQRAKELSIVVYRLTSEGPIAKDFGFRDQMRRAAISICSNIAEGDERDTDKDVARFFYIAKGSAAELNSQSEIAEAIGYLSKEKTLSLIEACEEISKMLRGLISARSSTPSSP